MATIASVHLALLSSSGLADCTSVLAVVPTGMEVGVGFGCLGSTPV